MREEKPQSIEQRENSKQKLVRKLVANARNIISTGVDIDYPVFEVYQKAVIGTPSGKERLNCSREALRRYDARLNQTNLEFHDKIIDACFEIIARFANKE